MLLTHLLILGWTPPQPSQFTHTPFELLSIINFAVCAVNEAATTGTKCYKDETLGDYPVNIYYCDDATNTDCCQVDFTYDCCEPEDSKNM